MKFVLLLIAFFFNTSFGYCQQGEETLTNERFLEQQLKIKAITESKKDVDLRIFLGTGITNGGEIIHITKKKKKWRAVQYEYYLDTELDNRPIKTYYKNKLKPTESWDKFWTHLQNLDIVILPDQEKIKSKLRTEITNKRGKGYRYLMIGDGSSYHINIKSEDQFNNYSFNNPTTYAKTYPHVSEVVSYANIISAIESQFSIKFRN